MTIKNPEWLKCDGKELPELVTCTKCGAIIQKLVDSHDEYAERCIKCGWEVNY